MYSIVLMAALTTGADVPDCGRRRGCYGGCYGGCYCGGYYGGGGCYGGCGGCYGGWGGCYGGWGGCYGSGGGYGGYGGRGGYYSTYNSAYVYNTAPVTYQSAQSPGAASARLIVHLPAGARLTVNDAPTIQTSSRRVFESPPLQRGRTYYYTLKAEVMRDGQTLTTTQEVAVVAGREMDVNLNIPSGTVTASR